MNSKFLLVISLFFSLNAAFAQNIQFADIKPNSILLQINDKSEDLKTITVFENSKISYELPKDLPEYNNPVALYTRLKSLGNDARIVFHSEAQSASIKLDNLKPGTTYYFDYFSGGKRNESLIAVTLSLEPTVQAKNIFYSKISSNSVTLNWINGSGDGRIVTLSKSVKPAAPADAVEYSASADLKNNPIMINDDAYIVYSGTDNKNYVKVSGLDVDSYTVNVYEFNGKGKSINYNIRSASSNPRTIRTLPDPPVAYKAKLLDDGGFIAAWSKVKNLQYFEFDVAYDEDFTQFVELYQAVNLGDMTNMEVIELNKGTYFYRVRALTESGFTDYSNIIKIKID